MEERVERVKDSLVRLGEVVREEARDKANQRDVMHL
jgi:polyhydroxyalkanoate synthesis regulator phasin